MKSKFLNNILLASLLCAAIPCFAEDAQAPASQASTNEVSELLKKLNITNPKPANQAPSPKPVAKPTPKPKTKPKPQPNPIIIEPKLVEISTPVPLEAKVPVKKRYLPDFVHNIYIRADYGVDSPSKVGPARFKKNSMYSGGIGYKFNRVLKADINYQFRDLDTKGALYKKGGTNTAYMLNAYVNLLDEDSSYLVPFITGGVGYSVNKFKNDVIVKGSTTVTFSGKNYDIAWNAGAGVSFILTKNVSLNASYKYVDLGKFKQVSVVSGFPSLGGTRKGRMYAQEVAAGVILNF